MQGLSATEKSQKSLFMSLLVFKDYILYFITIVIVEKYE